MKKLFWKDKTGRGFSNMLTFEDILNLENEEDWNGELLHVRCGAVPKITNPFSPTESGSMATSSRVGAGNSKNSLFGFAAVQMP